MLKGIVEMISNDKVLVGFCDGSHKSYKNIHNLEIFENDEVEIINDEIVKVLGVNEKLHEDIKKLEDKVFKK